MIHSKIKAGGKANVSSLRDVEGAVPYGLGGGFSPTQTSALARKRADPQDDTLIFKFV